MVKFILFFLMLSQMVSAFQSYPSLPARRYQGAGVPTFNCTVGQEYFRTDAYPGNNLYQCVSTNNWKSVGREYLEASDYNFSYTNGGGRVSVDLSSTGAKTATLTPCPAGVIGSSSNHYLYISGGVGTAERVLITGGTCTSGASSGTVTFTTANTHTGAWTLGSATAGIQEAFYVSTPSNIHIGPGLWNIYAPITIFGKGGNTVRIFGDGWIASRLNRASTFPAGNIINWDGSINPGNLELNDFTIMNCDNTFNNTSGSAIYIQTSTSDLVNVTNVYIQNGYNLMTVIGDGGIVKIDKCNLTVIPSYSYSTDHVMTLLHGGPIVTNSVIENLQQSSNKAAIYITRSDGISINNNQIKGYNGIWMKNDSSKIFNFVYIDNNIIDTIYQYGIYLESGAHNAVFDQLMIRGNHLVQTRADGSNASVGVYIQNDIEGLVLANNNIIGWCNTGVILGGTDKPVKGSVVSGNIISNNNIKNVGGNGLVVEAGSYLSEITITGNTIGNNSATTQPSYQQNGILFSGTSGFRGYTITGNNLYGNNNQPMVVSGTSTFANFVLGENNGLTDVYTSVASASSIDITFQDKVNITGTTTITTITPTWAGRSVTFQKTDAGSVSIGGGGNIASSAVTLSQYGTVFCTFNGTQSAWMCK